MGYLRFCSDEDLLRREPNLDSVFPRLDAEGNQIRFWTVQIDLGMEVLQRRLNGLKTVGEQFELGRLGQRSKETLGAFVTCVALMYIFLAADTQGDPTGYFVRKVSHYKKEADEIFEASRAQIDYDSDASGTIDSSETNQPMVARVLRG